MAGGVGRRIGLDKAMLLMTDGTPLLRHIAATAATVAHELMVVAGTVERCAYLSSMLCMGETISPLGSQDVLPATLTWQSDIPPYAQQGPLGGLYSGLRAATGDVMIAVACDMPYVTSGSLQVMLDLLDDNDIVLPAIQGHRQPLHAVYRRHPCLKAARQHLEAGQLALRTLCTDSQLRIRTVDAEAFRIVDPSERFWRSVNTPEEMREARLIPP